MPTTSGMAAMVGTALASLCPPYDSGNQVDRMTVISEDETHRRCTISALAAVALHILTIAGWEYQTVARHAIADYKLVHLAGTVFWYQWPVILLLLARRSCALIGIVAVPVLIFFVLRMHHVLVFWITGVNSMAVQKGDGLGFFEMLFSLALGAVALLWLAILLVMRLVDVFRGWRKA